MKSLGENLSDKDIKAMIRAADKNGDGKIDYEGNFWKPLVLILLIGAKI